MRTLDHMSNPAEKTRGDPGLSFPAQRQSGPPEIRSGCTPSRYSDHTLRNILSDSASTRPRPAESAPQAGSA